MVKRREKESEGDGLKQGYLRIDYNYDLDARWGVKREEFWLGYKLQETETCDDTQKSSCCEGRLVSKKVRGDELGWYG